MAIIGKSADEIKGLLGSANDLSLLIEILQDKKNPLSSRIAELEGIDDLLVQKKQLLKAQSDAATDKQAADIALTEARNTSTDNDKKEAKLKEMAISLSGEVKVHEKNLKDLEKEKEAHGIEVIKLANTKAAHDERVKRDAAKIEEAKTIIQENADLRAKVAAYQEQAQGLSAIG